MNPNSDLKNNESVMAVNAESSTVDAGYAESRISEYAAGFAAAVFGYGKLFAFRFRVVP